MARNSVINLLLACVCILCVRGAAEPGSGSAAAAGARVEIARPLNSREVAVRCYTLTARVRLLVLWISRSGVGAGRIAWSESEETRGLELLIGSDPARAPMKINRWGYIVERVSGPYAELVGVMTEAEEQSIGQARANVSRSNATHCFKAIRSSIQDGIAQSRVNYLKMAEDFTYREVDALLLRVPQEGGRVRHLSLPEGAETGFLFAVRSLVNESIDAYRKTGAPGVPGHGLRRYVFAGSHFELRRLASRVVRESEVNGVRYRQLLEIAFEARNLSNSQVSDFSITCGTEEPVTGIPVRIIYRPRWWFEAEMLLEGQAAAVSTADGGTPWRSGSN